MKAKLLTAIFFTSISFICYGQECGNPWEHKDVTAAFSNPKSSPTDGRISLRLAGNGSFVTILLGFIPEGTVDYDDGYDGPFINDGAAIEFYSFLGTTRLSIQALPELITTNVQVPLGYELTSDGSYTISIDAEFLSPDFDIILEDTQENIFTDLRQVPYTFSGMTGEAHNRFFLNLQYRSGTLNIEDQQATVSNIRAYFLDDSLILETKRTDIETVTLFDISGKRVLSSKFSKEIKAKNLTNSMYVVRFTTTSGEKISKKIIK
ncbi:MAG: T9SS type A sorting domain-containing protein [Kordia sp.]|uniref:T9SS type A sorting domain-containing protein n=1 Tax=Kordia sp. TaxID=1965332 RepID=UPI0038598985